MIDENALVKHKTFRGALEREAESEVIQETTVIYREGDLDVYGRVVAVLDHGRTRVVRWEDGSETLETV